MEGADNGDFTVKRFKTGISGLDDMLYGGIPQGSQTMIMGSPGAGKSLMTFQILYNNAKSGVPCTLILLDQKRNKFIKNALAAFPNCKDLADLEKSHMLTIHENTAEEKFTSRETVMLFISGILNAVQDDNPKIVAIDSVSILRSISDDDRSFTIMINKISDSLETMGVTALTTIEVSDKVDGDEIPGLYEESMFDGIIRIKATTTDAGTQHSIAILKLRYSNYDASSNPMEITPDGIVVKRQAK